MTVLKFCAALTLALVCAAGQSMTVGSGPRMEFEARGNPPELAGKFAAGFQSRGGLSYSVAHRYFRDANTRTYFGYDIVTESGPQPDTYQIRFFELGIGILDVAAGQPVEPTEWTKLPLGNLPAARVVHVGDAVSIELWSDPVSGETLTDYIHIQQAPQLPRSIITAPSLIRNGSLNNGSFRAVERTIPTVSGVARDFKVDDAELRIQQPIIKMNGVTQESPRLPVVNGVLLWFYIAGQGRYVMSLAPRPELGFVKAGEVRGGAVNFTMGKDQFTLECPTSVATGYAPYTLYVLHDAEWKPTSAAQSSKVLAGSVSPAEISSLRGQ